MKKGKKLIFSLIITLMGLIIAITIFIRIRYCDDQEYPDSISLPQYELKVHNFQYFLSALTIDHIATSYKSSFADSIFWHFGRSKIS